MFFIFISEMKDPRDAMKVAYIFLSACSPACLPTCLVVYPPASPRLTYVAESHCRRV